jgi:tetratricopeptide (TPR) repeat protein
MNRRHLSRAIAVTLMVVPSTVAPLTVARADQTDERLVGLFQQLEAAPVGDAAGVESRIWQIWIETGDAASERLMRQGIGAMAGRQLDLALRMFDRLVDRAPGFAEAWNKRATVHYLMGDFEASVADIQKVLDLEPRHFGALSGLGLIYDAVGEPAAALRSFEAALSINPHLAGTRERADALRKKLRGRRV